MQHRSAAAKAVKPQSTTLPPHQRTSAPPDHTNGGDEAGDNLNMEDGSMVEVLIISHLEEYFMQILPYLHLR